MAYSIAYTWDKEKDLIKQKCSARPYLPGVLILTGILALRLLMPEAASPIRQLLHPLTDDTTIQALGELSSDLMEGTPFQEAFTAFCQEIIIND